MSTRPGRQVRATFVNCLRLTHGHFGLERLLVQRLDMHLKQDEHFQIDQGVLSVLIDGQEKVIGKDDGVLTICACSR
jgi:mannose-6-phosphate isomerase-like protein (cupin superfamily)